MANNVSILNYANTFGDLLVQQNVVARELNNLGANTYTKNSGTLYLNGSGTGLSVTNTAVLGAAIISTTVAVAGDSSLYGNVFVTGSNYPLQVANNAVISKTIVTDTVNANTVVKATTLNSTGTTYANNIVSNNSITTVNLTATGAVIEADLHTNNSVSATYLNATTRGYFQDLTANNQINAAYLNLSGNVTSDLNVTTNINGHNYTGNQATFNSIQAGQVSIAGNFVISGSTVYNANTFTLNANSATGQISSLTVNRGSSGANAQILWNEPLTYWQILDVNNSTYYRILTDEYLSSSLNLNDQTKVATAAAAYQLQAEINNTNATLSSNVSTLTTNISNVSNNSNAAFSRANTSSNTFVGTTGIAIPNLGNITFRSNNGVVVSATANNLYVNTPQDLETTANPTFNSIYNLGNPLSVTNGGTGSSNGVQGLINLLPSTNGVANGYVLAANANTIYWAYNGPYFANNITFTAPQGGIVSTANTIQLAINDLEARKATLYNPSFTGAPTAPSAANGTVTTQIATTQFVANTVSLGITNAPSAANGTYSNQLATTQFVANTVSLGVASALSGGGTAQININGNANTVNNGFYTTSSFYLGTTSIPVNRTSVAQNLTGINIDGTAGNLSTYPLNQTVQTTSSVQFGSLGVGTGPTGTSGEIRATNSITAYYSDDRLKTRLGTIENALDKVMSLTGFYHEANDLAQSLGYKPVREVGVSAQDVQKVMPEVVAPAPIDEKYLTVRYERLVPLLIEAIKELKSEIDSLKN